MRKSLVRQPEDVINEAKKPQHHRAAVQFPVTARRQFDHWIQHLLAVSPLPIPYVNSIITIVAPFVRQIVFQRGSHQLDHPWTVTTPDQQQAYCDKSDETATHGI